MATTTPKSSTAKDPKAYVRVNVVCNDPMKKEYEGDTFTVGNDKIGTVRKFVKFNTTDGWHVQNIIADLLEEKVYQAFVSKTDENGNQYREAITKPAYTVTRLDPLSEEQLKDLAKRQVAVGLIV